MALLDVDPNEFEELHNLPDGQNELSIVSAEETYSQNGNKMLKLRLESPSDPLADDIYHNVMLPEDSDDRKTKAKKLGRLFSFAEAVGLSKDDLVTLDADQLIGLTCHAVLKKQSDPQFGERMQIGQFLKK